MGKKSRGVRGSEAQKEYLINYLENNSACSNDKLSSEYNANQRKLKWNSLAQKLNSIGRAQKDGYKWRKYWSDLRLSTRNKHSASKPLSALEKRIINIITKKGVDGNAKENAGVGFEDVYIFDGNRIFFGDSYEEVPEVVISSQENRSSTTKRELRFSSSESSDSKMKLKSKKEN